MFAKRSVTFLLIVAVMFSLIATVAAGLYGDFDGDGNVTSDDAVYLLRHTLFPDGYPIEGEADFDGDGDITSDDAVYLLRHTLFPDGYPLLITVYEPNNNVARGKSYVASEPFTTNPPSMGYQDIDGKELTDGVKNTGDLYGTCWHAFDYRKYQSSNGEGRVVIDLGAVTAGLIEFRAEMINYATSGIDAPTYMKVYVSEDGDDYKVLGEMKPVGGNICDYVLRLGKPVSGRYVKVTVGVPASGVFMFCSEIEVYDSTAVKKEATEVSEEVSYEEESSEPEKTGVIENGVLDIEEYPLEFRAGSRFALVDGALTGVTADDTPASICRELVNMAGVQILDAGGNKVTAGNVADGYSLVQYSDGKIAKQYFITVSDTEVAPSAPLTARSTVKHTSSVLYTLSTVDAETGKTISLTFDKKDWGTWNIGTWYIDGLRLAGGGTDWEYVYRASPQSSGGIVWSGGNHGNETLVSLKFYEGTTGEEIDLSATGAAHDFDCFVMKESTRLHWGEAANYYANVVRTYTVVGRTIYFDVTYDFVKDCWYQLSYTCMFPVPKTHGLYIDFLNDDGTTTKVASLKVGAADYSGPYYGKLPASAAHIYGYLDTQYSFLVQVYSKADSVENFKDSYKLFYWDMNAGENKLYFSKFDMNGNTKVASGTHWDTSCSWTLLIDNEE